MRRRTAASGSQRNHSVGTMSPGARSSVAGAMSAKARTTFVAIADRFAPTAKTVPMWPGTADRRP